MRERHSLHHRATRSCVLQDEVPVHFLMFNVDAPDGVSRAVLTLADHLSLTHSVEIISLHRRHRGPAFPISERIKVTYLGDRAPGGRKVRVRRSPATRDPPAVGSAPLPSAARRGFPSSHFSPTCSAPQAAHHPRRSTGVDPPDPAHVRGPTGTPRCDHHRPGPPQLRVAEQPSADPGSHPRGGPRGLNAFVTLTPTDAVDYPKFLAASAVKVTTIPNALSWPVNSGQAPRAAGHRRSRKVGPAQGHGSPDPRLCTRCPATP